MTRRRLQAVIVGAVTLALAVGVAQSFAGGSRDGKNRRTARARTVAGDTVGPVAAASSLSVADRMQRALPAPGDLNSDGSPRLVGVPLPAVELPASPKLYAPDLRPPEAVAPLTLSDVSRGGQLATVDLGKWSGDGVITYSYQWQTCDADGLNCQDKPGRIFPSERLGDLDVGKRVRARVTAASVLGTRVEFTGLSGVIAPEAPAIVAAPVALPPERDGGALVVSGGEWRGTKPFDYEVQWQQCDPSGVACVDVLGANTDSLVPSAFARDATFRALVRVSNSVGSTLTESTATKAAAVPRSTSPSMAAARVSRSLQVRSTIRRVARRQSCAGNPYILLGSYPVAMSSGGNTSDVVEGDTVSTDDGIWGIADNGYAPLCTFSHSSFSYTYAWRGGGGQLAMGSASYTTQHSQGSWGIFSEVTAAYTGAGAASAYSNQIYVWTYPDTPSLSPSGVGPVSTVTAHNQDQDGDSATVYITVWQEVGGSWSSPQYFSQGGVCSGCNSTASPTLLTGERYKFEAQSVDSHGLHSSVAAVEYVVDNLPTTPTLISPISSTSVSTVSPTLSAESSDADGSVDPTSFMFEVTTAADTGFASAMWWGWVPASTTSATRLGSFVVPRSSLQDGQTYIWRVKAMDSHYYESGWSSAQTFKVDVPKFGRRATWPMWSAGPLAVNLATGNAVLSAPSPAYTTGAGTIAAAVTYNSLDTASSALGLGDGWKVGSGLDGPTRLIDHNLISGDSDTAELIYPDGSSDVYSHIAGGSSYVAPGSDTSQLTRTVAAGSPHFTLVDSDGSIYTFDQLSGSDFVLASAVTADAAKTKARIGYTFGTGGRLTSVTAYDDTSGTPVPVAQLSLAWPAIGGTCSGGVLCITGPDGAVWTYARDGSDRLNAVSYQLPGSASRSLLSITAFDGASSRPVTIKTATDLDSTNRSAPYGVTYQSTHAVTLGYTSASGVYKLTTVEEGPITVNSGGTTSTPKWTFSYHPGSVTTTTPAAAATHSGEVRTNGGYTIVTPPRHQGSGVCHYTSASDAKCVVYWDTRSHPMETVDPLGNKTLVQIDQNDQTQWTQDAQGNTTDYTYDPVDKVLTKVQGPTIAGDRVTTYSYYDEKAIGSVSGATYTPGPALHGLVASWFKRADLVGRPDAQTTLTNGSSDTLDYTWGTSAPPGLSGYTGDFSLRLTGDLNITTAGNYNFRTDADSGIRLVIDNTLVLNSWTDKTKTTTTAATAIHLTAGRHKILLDYYSKRSVAGSELKLQYTGPDTSSAWQTVAGTILTPAWNNATSSVSATGKVSFSHFPVNPSGTAGTATGLPDYSLTRAPVNGATANLITTFAYDSFGRITQKVMPRGNTGLSLDATSGDASGSSNTTNFGTTYSYYPTSGTGSSATPTTPCTGSSTFQLGLLKTVQAPGLAAVTTVYDAAGRPLMQTKAAGSICNTYDDQGRLSTSKAPDEANPISYDYDAAGHARTITQGSAVITNVYDEAGRVVNTTDTLGANAEYAYDSDGNRTSQKAKKSSGGTQYTTSYTYNDADQLTSQTDPAGRSYTFSYDSRGNLTGTLYPNSTYSLQAINANGWQTALCNHHGTTIPTAPAAGCPSDDPNPISDYAYTYSQDGQKLTETRSHGTNGLTTSGAEITDLTRATGVEGDGRAAPDSSYGIWQDTTNLNPNGGVETNTTGWTGSASPSRSTGWAKFGSYSYYIDATITNNDASAWAPSVSASAGQQITASAWLNVVQNVAVGVKMILFWYDGSGTEVGRSDSSSFTGTGVTRLSVTSTAPASTATVRVRIVMGNSVGTQTMQYYVDGVQYEAGSIATPYIETDGATARRSGVSLQLPAPIGATASQGWIAARIRAGFNATTPPNQISEACLLCWEQGNSATRLKFFYSPSGNVWTLNRGTALGSDTLNTATQSFTAGSKLTLVAAWTPTQLKISINGAAFTTQSASLIPDLTSALAMLGSSNFTNSALDGDILWAATGSGTLTDTDASTIHANGDTDPTVGALPGQTANVWTADTSATLPPVAPTTVALTGNETTDTTRQAASQGDGRPADSSTGIWQATTNLITNGGSESNLTNWDAINTATLTRDASWHQFGHSSVKTTTPGSSTGEGIGAKTATGLALSASTVLTGSIWIKGTGTLTATLRLTNTDTTTTDGSPATITLSSTPQRVNVTATVATGKTADQAQLRLITNSTQAISFSADGAQIEQGSLATPYVETDGTAVRRNAGVVLIGQPIGATAAQGWISTRVRLGFASGGPLPGSAGAATVFSWQQPGGSDAITLAYGASGALTLTRRTNGSSATVTTTQSHAVGDLATITAAWTPTGLKLSVNGASFTSTSTSAVPVGLGSRPLVLGQNSLDYQAGPFDGDILWAAIGAGSLENADATALNAFGNNDPSATSLANRPTVIWTADSPASVVPETTTYGYDAAGRLATTVAPDGTARRYCFDADSNRTYTMAAIDDPCGTSGAVSTYTYASGASTPVDALTSQTGPNRSFTYDGGGSTPGDGTMTGRGSDTLTWDARGRISTITTNGNTACYSYDPAGQLITRTFKLAATSCTSPTSTTNYLLGGTFETDAAGTILTTYIGGPAGTLAAYAGAPTTSSQVSYQYYSGHGDLAAEANPAGTTTASHGYDAWGAPTDPQPANQTAHRYTGRWDKQYDTSASIVLMGARPYDPALGRFLAVDPVDGGSYNTYDYTYQDPINVYDLDGECPVCIAVLRAAPKAAKGVVKGGKAIVRGAKSLFAPASKAGQVSQIAKSADINFKLVEHRVIERQLHNFSNTGITARELEAPIRNSIATRIYTGRANGFFTDTVVVRGFTVEYRAFRTPSGRIDVNTAYIRSP